MKFGLIARADLTGLGNQTWELYQHLRPDRTYVIDLTEVNAGMGKQTGLLMEHYPDGTLFSGFPTNEQCQAMLQGIDVLLSVEIPYNYYLFEAAREMGVKTVLVYNYEFLDYLANSTLPFPDVLLAPSRWHLEDVQRRFGNQTTVKYLPPPVDTSRVPYRPRKFAQHFVHVAGHKTYLDRNGTQTVLAAMPYVLSPIQLTIHSQYPLAVTDPRITVIDTEVKNYWDIYNNPNYDVMLLPRRYGGLSLQLNEAQAAGMPVIMTDVPPQNGFLPPEALIAVEGKEQIQTRTLIDCYHPDPIALAAKIDELYNNPELVQNLSRRAGAYAKGISWKALLPAYRQLLEGLA